MAFTVTATQSGSSAGTGITLLVRVLTNAIETGGTSHGANTVSGSPAPSGSLTPAFSGSWVGFAISADNLTTMSAAAANNVYDYNANNPGQLWAASHGHYTGTVTAATPLTYGAGSIPSGQDHANWCAYEVPASGGSIAIDGSSPVGANNTGAAAVTSASFTPPGSCVLVAMVCAGGTGTGTGITVTITDTSGLGLVWTRRSISSTSDNFQPTFIFTATVGGAAPAAVQTPVSRLLVPPGRRSPMAWRRFGTPPAPIVLPPTVPQTYDVNGTSVTTSSASGFLGKNCLSQILGTGTGQYFADQSGKPILYMQDVPWGLIGNAGRYNGGNWQADIDAYMSARGSQGFTTIRVHIFGTTKTGGINDNGDTWDGVHPFVTGTDPTSGFNNTYWARVDYMVNSASAQGMTCELTAIFDWDFRSGVFASTWTTTQCTNYGNALGTRYKNFSNIMWFFGDDYNQDHDTQYTAVINGIRAAGDTHLASVENYSSGTSSRRDLSGSPTGTTFAWGAANAQWNLVYYYWVTYFAIEFAYQETSPLLVTWGDGYFYGDSGGGSGDDRVERNMVWWALASGARGVSTGSDAIWQWPSTAPAAVTTENWYVNVAGKIRTLFESLTGWQTLLPDTGNVLVTSGRGTRQAYSNQFWLAGSGTDTYVAASRTPDGGSGSSLAVIYCSTTMSITIDQTKMVSGYSATWYDPANGTVKSHPTVGSTYSSSGLGNNSAGNADWVLVLQGPSGTTYSIAGSSAAISSATGAITQSMAISGSGASVSSANGTLGLVGVVTGSSVTSSAADGTIVQKMALTGFASSVSSANGVFGLTGVIAGSSVTGSSASGSITATLVTSGSSASASSAAGTISALMTLSGSSATSSAANGTFGLLGVISGTSATASSTSADVALVRVLILVGSSATVSGASGAIVATLVLAGSATTASSTAATVVATLVLSGSSATASAANGVLGLNGVVAGSSSTQSSASGAVTMVMTVAGSSATISSGSGSLTRVTPLAGSSSTSSFADGAVVMIGVVAGSSATVSAATGAVILTLLVAGQSATASQASGSLSRVTPLAGSSATTSSASGAVTIQTGAITYQIAGSSATQSAANGTVSLFAALAGTSSSASAATGALVLMGVLAGSAASVSGATGSISLTGAVTGSATSASVAAGSITLTGVVAGSSSTQSSATGWLSGGPISGTSSTSSAASGTISQRMIISGASATTSQGSGDLTVVGKPPLIISAVAASVSTASGAIVSVMALSGSSSTASSASGSIGAKGAIAGTSVTVSAGLGAIIVTGRVSGSASTNSGAIGSVAVVLRLAGVASAQSRADGWLGLPFTAGALPDEVTAVVWVSNALDATVDVDSVVATIETNEIRAEVT